jgi:hypothetical protein
MKKIIKKILREDRREEFLNKIIKLMKNDFPLFKNLRVYGLYNQLSEDDLIYIFSGIFGKPITIMGRTLMDENRKVLYYEDYDGVWEKRENDEYGRRTYKESSNGDWYKREYDKYGNISYEEYSDGYWYKREYDENRNLIYYENSRGEIRDNR